MRCVALGDDASWCRVEVGERMGAVRAVGDRGSRDGDWEGETRGDVFSFSCARGRRVPPVLVVELVGDGLDEVGDGRSWLFVADDGVADVAA